MQAGLGDNQEALMSVHKYKVGQFVKYSPGRSVSIVASRDYKVVQQLPASEGENQYRIKSASETFERMARECDLSTR